MYLSRMVRNYKKKKSVTWSDDDMVKALADHKDRKLSLFKAAKIYGNPESTLRDHMNRTGEATCKKGRPTILTSKEEDEIAMICEVFVRWKFGIGKKEIVQVVRDYCKGKKRSNPFKGSVPGDDWWRGFMRRHPQLVQRRPQALQMVRAESATGIIRDWFQNCLKPSLHCKKYCVISTHCSVVAPF